MENNKMSLCSSKILSTLILLFLPFSVYAHLLSITATVPFPATVTPLSTTTATFTVTNTTSRVSLYAINQSIFASGSGLTLTGSTCGNILTPGASCTLQVTLTAPLTPQASTGTIKVWAKPSLDVVDYCINVGNTAVQYAYVTDESNLYQCGLNTLGNLNTCSLLNPAGTTGWSPYTVSFATVNGTQYGYVADNISNLFQCNINASGVFTSCSVLPPVLGWGPTSVTFETFNGVQYGYVVDANTVRIYKCPVNPNGSFGTCTITPGIGAPQELTFATAQNGQLYAYVTEGISNLISQCVVNTTTGDLGVCNSLTTVPGWTPVSLAFATTQAGTRFAYVADTVSNVIYQCGMNADGSFSSCTATPTIPPVGWNTVGITFGTQQGIEYAYVADKNGNVYQCNFNTTNGNLSGCAITPSSGAPAWAPRAVAFGTI